MIQSYSFGQITINDKTYQNDVIVFPDHVYSDWWRGQGHLLQMSDLQPVLKFKPELLVVGTGAQGVMSVPQTLIEDLNNQGIEVKAVNTHQAVKAFNQTLKQGKKAAAALHLTC